MSTVTIGIDQAEITELSARLKRTVDDVQAVAIQSAQATAVWLRGRVADDLFEKTGIAQALFTRRVRKYLRTGVDAGGRVFVGLFRPEASQTHLGTLSQQKDGARGGKYFFKGAFVATMPNGFVGIFKRTGKFGRGGNARLERIGVEHVDLPSAQEIIRAHELPAEVYFRSDLERRLKGVLA